MKLGRGFESKGRIAKVGVYGSAAKLALPNELVGHASRRRRDPTLGAVADTDAQKRRVRLPASLRFQRAQATALPCVGVGVDRTGPAPEDDPWVRDPGAESGGRAG
jgi:hypothetical protein